MHKRAVVYAALIAALFSGMSDQSHQAQVSTRLRDSSPVASHHANRGPCFGPEYEVKHSMSTEIQQDHVRNLIRCGTDRFSVPGGYETALRIATCESSLYAWADNGHGDLGLFQISSWDTRARYWLERSWFPFHWPPRWSLARANVLVALRWAHTVNSWSAWACR